MNRALRAGDRVEFRDTPEAADFCAHDIYSDRLNGLIGGTQKWDEATDKTIEVVERRDFVQAQAEQQTINGIPPEPVKRHRPSRPLLVLKLSWTQSLVLTFASFLRLDNRARRNRFAAKIEAMKAHRRAERRRRK